MSRSRGSVVVLAALFAACSGSPTTAPGETTRYTTDDGRLQIAVPARFVAVDLTADDPQVPVEVEDKEAVAMLERVIDSLDPEMFEFWAFDPEHTTSEFAPTLSVTRFPGGPDHTAESYTTQLPPAFASLGMTMSGSEFVELEGGTALLVEIATDPNLPVQYHSLAFYVFDLDVVYNVSVTYRDEFSDHARDEFVEAFSQTSLLDS